MSSNAQVTASMAEGLKALEVVAELRYGPETLAEEPGKGEHHQKRSGGAGGVDFLSDVLLASRNYPSRGSRYSFIFARRTTQRRSSFFSKFSPWKREE